MTDTTKQETKKGNKPTHTLYTKSYVDGSSKLVKVGVAWKHSKGDGFNISLNDIVAFENKEKLETSSNPKSNNQLTP